MNDIIAKKKLTSQLLDTFMLRNPSDLWAFIIMTLNSFIHHSFIHSLKVQDFHVSYLSTTWPTIMFSGDHYFRTFSPSVHPSPLFKNKTKQIFTNKATEEGRVDHWQSMSYKIYIWRMDFSFNLSLNGKFLPKMQT